MLILSLPTGETKGDCKVNARPCEYEIDGAEIRFRYKEPDPDDQAEADWDRRDILARINQGKATYYTCSPRRDG